MVVRGHSVLIREHGIVSTVIRGSMSEIMKLWDILPHPDGSVVRWMAKKDKSIRGDFVTTAADLEAVAASLPGWNMYVAPNPCTPSTATRHSAEEVTHWSWLFLDIDPVEENAEPDKFLHEALTWLGEWMGSDFFRYPPTVIDSGRGYQAWIRLDDLYLYNEVCGIDGSSIQKDGAFYIIARSTARRAAGFWLGKLSERLGTKYGCRLDTTCSDLPRVMRMPGTVNQKTGRMATIKQIGPIRRGFASKLIIGTPKQVLFTPEIVQQPEGTPWWVVFQKLTPKARTFLMEGWEEPGRHSASWHTAKSLHEHGISYDQAWIALQKGNELCRPEPLGIEELRRQLDGVYKP